MKYRLRLRLGQDYEQNGGCEKCGRVRLNQLKGSKVGGRYGARKVEISGAFQKERECRSRVIENQQRVQKTASGSLRQQESFGVLNCEGHSEFIQQSHLVLLSPLALPFLIALACLCTVHLFLCWQPCFKVHSRKQKHICMVRKCVIK